MNKDEKVLMEELDGLLKEARKALVCHARDTTRDLCERISAARKKVAANRHLAEEEKE